MRIKTALLVIIFAAASCLHAADAPGWITGHITTCSGLINNYPADSTNWFYRGQHNVVQYFAYILFPVKSVSFQMTERYYLFENPYRYYSGSSGFSDSEDYVFENKWVSPSGKVICEKMLKWSKSSTDKKMSINDRQYVPYVFANYAGIKQMYRENGQERLPDETGLYHIDLYINGILSSVTFFEMKD